MNRRHFIQTTGLSLASLLISDLMMARSGPTDAQLIQLPDEASAIINGKTIKLASKSKDFWTFRDMAVNLKNTGQGMVVTIQAPDVKLSAVTLRWKITDNAYPHILNDHWERTYGDVSWHTPNAAEILPWYFLENNGGNTHAFGVKTGTGSFCFWQMDKDQLSLTLDTRSGGAGVQLGDRTLKAAEIVTMRNRPNESVFQCARRFTTLMCDKARLPKEPVYGINDWYFSYGNNSDALIIQHTELMAPMAEGLTNRPFSVIDAGWFRGAPSVNNDCAWGDNMTDANEKFGDMAKLAAKIKTIGMRPGIWTRPLCGSHKDPESLLLPLIAGREKNKPVLDPSIPENLQRVKDYFKLYHDWGFEMVKFDFTSFDIFGRWGFEMLKDRSMSTADWSMHDASKTNAEIVLNFYQSIRQAAGEMYVIGCNTFSHLAAGIFELNRIGDDTSGNEWERTRKMGVNTLAFRSIQQGSFYSADGDCVGITPKVAWAKNKQWMELLSKSGTPLFISAQPDATGDEQKTAIKEAFKWASQKLPVGEPIDWIDNPTPKRWRLNGELATFNWA